MSGTEGRESKPWRRRLLFIPGFDPRSPAAYHAMWKEDAPLQAQVSGAEVSVDPRPARHPLGLEWTITTCFDGREAETRVTLLRWDDLVRKWWVRGDWGMMADTPIWSWTTLRSGVYALTARRARPMFYSLIAPPLLLAALLALALLTAGGLALASPWAALPALALTPWLLRFGWRRADAAFACAWVSQCFSYSVRSAKGLLADQDARCDAFARALVKAVETPGADEVVLAGFSLGANQAIRVMGRALALRPDLGRTGPNVVLLTLGQNFPAYARLPDDRAFREALRAFAAARHVGWVDCTSASDPASTCAIHPLEGVGATDDPARPVRRSPRFHKVLTPERFRAVRRDPLAFHFQYLRSVDRPGAYDWFLMASGPDPLTRREAA